MRWEFHYGLKGLVMRSQDGAVRAPNPEEARYYQQAVDVEDSYRWRDRESARPAVIFPWLSDYFAFRRIRQHLPTSTNGHLDLDPVMLRLMDV